MKKKTKTGGSILKVGSQQPKEDWFVFVHERMSSKGTAVSDYRLTTTLHEASEVVRDLVFARTHKSGHNVTGKLYKAGLDRITPLPVYACRATRDQTGKVIVRKTPEGKLTPLA